MTSLLHHLSKPEYLFRPPQLWRRLRTRRWDAAPRREEVVLPWGMTLRVRPEELIGSSLCRLGVYDLTVSEAVWRLLEPGEQAVDVGANIGYMTSIMAARVGPSGRVVAFEPHPAVFEELARHVGRWAGLEGAAPIEPHRKAVADAAGEAVLHVPRGFDANRGIASLHATAGPDARPSDEIRVSTVRLDDVLDPDRPTALLKIDVEGGESAVLAGASGLLRAGRIRDVVYEDHDAYPTPASRRLTAAGYTIFRLDRRFWGPQLVAPTVPKRAETWDPPGYLATRAPGRAARRMAARGWKSLRTTPLRAAERPAGAHAEADG